MFISSFFLYQTLYIYVFFALKYHILNFYQIFQKKIIKKKYIYILSYNQKIIYIFQFLKFIIICLMLYML
jgi:hypothetical protein